MAATQVSKESHPQLTRPMWFAFIAFVVFVVWALFPNSGRHLLAVTPAEYEQLKKFTLFFIGALLPSDALVRFGRNLLFTEVEDADKAAKDAPASTLAQNLAFAVFLVIAVVMLFSDEWIDQSEAPKIIDVARTLVIALLPSDAGIRFGRAIYLRSRGGTPSSDRLGRV
jgi:hypothetical protein